MNSLLRIGLCALLGSTSAACSLLVPTQGDETPAQCLERWETHQTYQDMAIKKNFNPVVYPTFAYDVGNLEAERLNAWIGWPEQTGPLPTGMSFTFGGGAGSYKAWLASDVGPDGAFFSGDGIQAIRERGQPAPFKDLIAQGCARTAPGVTFVDMQFSFNGFGDEDTDVSESSLTIPSS